VDEEKVARTMEAAYLEFEPGLRRRLTALVRDPTTAEDLTQEAFLRLLAEVRADRTPENVGGWLWRVARNLVTSRGRRMAVADRHRGELVRDVEFASPEVVAIQGEAQSELIAALGVLDRTGLAAVTMAAHGLSAPEIGQSIGRSPNATRTLLCRARARVRAAVLAAHPA
jgi:RNA polymerase sigma-70 factor (ECF subfamily)